MNDTCQNPNKKCDEPTLKRSPYCEECHKLFHRPPSKDERKDANLNQCMSDEKAKSLGSFLRNRRVDCKSSYAYS